MFVAHDIECGVDFATARPGLVAWPLTACW